MMYLIFLDTETTGLDPLIHVPIEIAYKVMDHKSQKIILSYESLITISPDNWAERDLASQKIHRCSYEMLLSGKSSKSICADITADLNHLLTEDKSGCFLCQNPSFDRAFFNQIVPVNIQQANNWPYHWLDLASMVYVYYYLKKIDPIEEKDLTKDAIAKNLNLNPENKPHRAMNGVNHLIDCYLKMFKDVS